MPKGKNPRSHHNRPAIAGIQKLIKLPESQWILARLVGCGNASEGIREMIRAMEIQCDRRIVECASAIGCEPTVEAIKARIRELCPGIESGRKKLADLIQEIMLGEATLAIEDGVLVRDVAIASIAISSPMGELVELRQEYASGKITERDLKGISEKIQAGESSELAAIRGIKEELGLDLKVEFEAIECTEDSERSAYVGLRSRYTIHKYSAWIESPQTEYREVQASKVTAFGWRSKD